MLRLLAVVSLLTTVTGFSANSTKPAAAAINALGVRLLASAAKPSENTLLSPYSIQVALAMTYAGAEGLTREQMANVLHYPEDRAELSRSFAALDSALEEMSKQTAEIATRSKVSGGPSDAITLTLANRLFGQKGYDFRKAFLAMLEDTYRAPLIQLDFAANPAAATKDINEWVEQQTRNRIQNLVPDRALTKLTRLVLVNAIYLKAPWAEEFNERATAPRRFQVRGSQALDVATMQRQGTFGYEDRDGFRAVTIPYIGEDLHLLVLLPDESDGIGGLEQKLTPEVLDGCANLERREVDLYLPKFKVAPPVFALGEALQAFGMTSAFDIPEGSANFDGIAPRLPTDYLYISDVFHKTFIEIDEKGTEAAAATAVVMMRATSALLPKPEPIEVRVDRPFLFAIQHRPSGACLFLGRVMDPR